MSVIFAVLRRELWQYFATPLAYVFLIVFLTLSSVFTFYIGNFFGRAQADLISFFSFHPWLYLFFIPALAMRLWSEEMKSGTIELLLTMPVSSVQLVLGKFLATWIFVGIALLLTFPLWVTVNLLGQPDNGVIAVSYAASFVLAGCYLAISAFLSAVSQNQVIAFVLSIALCLLFMLSGFNAVTDLLIGWAPLWLIETVQSFSFITHYSNQMIKGVISLENLLYLLVVMLFFLLANIIMVERNRV